MGNRKLQGSIIALALIALGLVAASSASAALTSQYHPNAVSRDFNTVGHGAPHGWTASTAYEGVSCILPGVLCPGLSHDTVTTGGAPPTTNGTSGWIRSSVAGVASVGGTAISTWRSPGFTYTGGQGNSSATVEFSLDHQADVSALINLGGNASYTVFADDTSNGSSLTLVPQTQLSSHPWTTIPTVSVDPNQLNFGHNYRFRIETRFSYPIGVIPSAFVGYDNVVLTAVANDRDNDNVGDDVDNCPDVFNPGQRDTNGNGIGDACERHLLTVTKNGSGSGFVSSNPAGIACGGDCSEVYDHGQQVTLTATPSPGSTFVGFTGGGCHGAAPTCTVTMSRARHVNAQFAGTYTLTVTKTGPGDGTVGSNPAGISCGLDCSEAYPVGTDVTLTATAAPGSTFQGFSNGNCHHQLVCTVRMSRDRNIEARFSQP